MAVLRKKTRVVYFRITEEQFAELNTLCLESGARSISDLVRDAVRKHDSAPGDVTESSLAVLVDRLAHVVRQLEERLAEHQNILRGD